MRRSGIPRHAARRVFILTTVALALLSLAVPAWAQQKVRRVGLLTNGSSAPTPGRRATWADDVLVGLESEGYRLGVNLELVVRLSDGDTRRLPGLAQEIAEVGVDVVVAVSDDSVTAMLAASKTTPIIMVAGGDPVAKGVVASMARPGGRVTGITLQIYPGDVKRLEFLREALPNSRSFAVLVPPWVPREQGDELLMGAARRLNIELSIRAVAALGAPEYAMAFEAMRRDAVAGVLVAASQAWFGNPASVGQIAQEHGLPTICEWDFMARTGCVFAFGHNLTYAWRRTGWYAAQVLKGALPAELPVEQSDAWKLTVNLEAAGRLGLTIPPSLLARADEVIE